MRSPLFSILNSIHVFCLEFVSIFLGFYCCPDVFSYMYDFERVFEEFVFCKYGKEDVSINNNKLMKKPKRAVLEEVVRCHVGI